MPHITAADDRTGWQALSAGPYARLKAAVLEVVQRECQVYGGCSAILVYANAPMEPGYPVTCQRMIRQERWEHTIRALRDLVRDGQLERVRRGKAVEYRPGP